MAPKRQTDRNDEHDRLMTVIFGDAITGDVGMKKKVDEIHELLIQAKNVGGFFGGIKSLMGWMLVLGLFFALIKGWFAALVSYLLHTN